MGDQPTIPDRLFFRIGEVAELVGVEPHVLRYWENEFRIRPKRSGAGQRMYRRADIELFLRIQSLLHAQGFTIAGARKALNAPASSEASEAPVGVDRVQEALTRLTQLRQRMADAKRRWASEYELKSL